MSESVNPYVPPSAPINQPKDEFGEVKVFSVSGRIGRVRYIGYSFLIGFVVFLIGGMLSPFTLGISLVLAFVVGIVLQFMLTIQRCHDFNMSGWLSLIIIVPLAQFVFWVVPGTEKENRWGKKPPPNTSSTIVLALVVPLVGIFLIGMLAAIAIPQYQKYVERAKAAKMKQVN
jgi:uncharacterized membrane protein YhaH (DUF805 family)